MKLTVYLLGMITLLSFKSFGQTKYDEDKIKKEVLAAREEKIRAIVGTNQDSLEHIYANNSKVYRAHAVNNTIHKHQFKEHVKTSKIKILAIKNVSVEVAVVDENLGIITGTSIIDEIVNGKRKLFNVKFEDIYYKVNGHWKCVFFHSDNIKK